MTDLAAAYRLHDPREIAAEAPYTYFLPQAVELAAVAVGDLVQLVIEHAAPADEYQIERMWVAVREAAGDNLEGTLQNQPFEPTAILAPGHPVRFQRHHIIDIVWADPNSAPEVDQPRQYWARCMVDQSVLDGEASVEYLYREGSDLELQGDDTYPDSGWRIRGRVDPDAEEPAEPPTPAYVALGAILNRDDSWLHLIDAPVGAAFMRDFETGDYTEVERDDEEGAA